MGLKKPKYKPLHSSTMNKHKKLKRKQRNKRLHLHCPLCSSDKEISHMSISACGHVFCTKCLRAALLVDSGVACPSCGQKIMKRKRCYSNLCNSLQLQ